MGTRRPTPLAPDALPPGIRRTSIPTPFPMGPVNCYLSPGPPVTLIDPGPDTDRSRRHVEALLSGEGLKLADVDRVVVTHAHPDHFGVVGWVVAHSEARVIAAREEVGRLVDGYARGEMLTLVARLGIPAVDLGDLAEAYRAVEDLVHPLEPGAIDAVDDGDRLDVGGRVFEAHVTPGHAPGHLSLFDPTAGILLSGDHLLARITPNPVMEPDPWSEGGRRRTLVEYLGALDRFADLDPPIVLPGHGVAFAGVDRLVTALHEHHERRADQVLALVRDLGTPTAYEVAQRLFPERGDFGVFLGVSEAVAHLDLLAERGLVEEGLDSPARFAVARG